MQPFISFACTSLKRYFSIEKSPRDFWVPAIQLPASQASRDGPLQLAEAKGVKRVETALGAPSEAGVGVTDRSVSMLNQTFFSEIE